MNIADAVFVQHVKSLQRDIIDASPSTADKINAFTRFFKYLLDTKDIWTTPLYTKFNNALKFRTLEIKHDVRKLDIKGVNDIAILEFEMLCNEIIYIQDEDMRQDAEDRDQKMKEIREAAEDDQDDQDIIG